MRCQAFGTLALRRAKILLKKTAGLRHASLSAGEKRGAAFGTPAFRLAKKKRGIARKRAKNPKTSEPQPQPHKAKPKLHRRKLNQTRTKHKPHSEKSQIYFLIIL
jgi:hypothetical protein